MEVLSIHLKGYHTVYIVFDALDEFVGNQEELISTLKSLGGRICLLVTSRDKPAIRRMFQQDGELRIRADDGDIRKLVMSRLHDNERLHIFVTDCDDLRQNILTTIVEKAQGMFFLADVHISLLAHSKNRDDLVEKLNKLPQTIASTYAHFLERAEPERKLAYEIFGWIAFAKRPLTVLELKYALAMRPGTKKLSRYKILDFDFISSVCIGLVVVDGRGYVRFAHPTFLEYNLSQQDKHFPRIQQFIMPMCLTYMSFDIFRSPDIVSLSKPDLSEKYPFLAYSSSDWAIHARECARGTVEEDVLAFLPARAKIALSFEQPPDSEPEIPRTPTWFAAHYGLVNVMEVLLGRQGVDRVDLRHENTLCIAAHAGQIGMVKLLLSRDDVDVNQADKVTYLHDYSINGTDSVRPTFCTPLIAAASNGHKRTVKILLKSKRMKPLNFLPPDRPTALSAAIFGNHIGVVKLLLLQPGIDTFIWFLDETPPMLSKRKCRDNIVKMFIEREDGVDGVDGRQCSTSDPDLPIISFP
ncbi:ankyrin repeat-containing domain protein [Desarmillaria ectypa]|nr:ankyrin repeat-containing domain protein [Desarmillaria ectypa]KAK0200533.1 ankyrin repeat-containing domain protein [Desarmillaria ectypa]